MAIPAWGLEGMEMNMEMVVTRWKRVTYSLLWIAAFWVAGDGSYVWKFFRRRFWRFWLGAPIGDILSCLALPDNGSQSALRSPV